MKNKKILLSFLLTMVFLPLGCAKQDDANVAEEDYVSIFNAGDEIEIEGKVICAHCYALNEENTGHDHNLPQSGFKENCAQFCSLQGYPIGVLLESELDGTRVWVIRTAGQIFADYMTETVRIKGEFVDTGVLDPLSIDLKTGEEEWTAIM